MSETHACPRCSTKYHFDGPGLTACPSCGLEIEHEATPPPVQLTPEEVELRRLERKNWVTFGAIFGMLLALFAGVALIPRSAVEWVTKNTDLVGTTAYALAVVFIGIPWVLFPWLVWGKLREIRDELRKMNARAR